MFNMEELKEIKEAVYQNFDRLSERSVLIGFDGYVDKLVRLKKSQEKSGDFYETINEFVQYIINHNCESSDIEMNCIAEKVGGNGTLLAQAISRKGIETACIGAMGYPKIHPVYQSLNKQCNLLSLEEPASSLAMEFNNGKLMFGDIASLNRIDWNNIKNKIGLENMIPLFNKSDIMGFCNWSNLLNSNDILEGILNDICPELTSGKRSAFFDLADPSAKNDKQFMQLFAYMVQLRKYYWVILGLNPKEGLIIYNRFFNRSEAALTIEMEEEMRLKLPADELVIHGLDYADAGTKKVSMQRSAGEFNPFPKIVTGGGDNFNSGYFLGKLMDLPVNLCATLGNLSSLIFVSQGYPASINDILKFILNFEDIK